MRSIQAFSVRNTIMLQLLIRGTTLDSLDYLNTHTDTTKWHYEL